MENSTIQFEQKEDQDDRPKEKPSFWFLPDFEKNPDIPRPLLLWRSLKKQYPDILKHVSVAATKHWERYGNRDSSLLPISEWALIMGKYFARGSDIVTIIQEADRIAPVCSWALGQGIYRFDSDLSRAVTETELPNILPLEIFSKLPEYCIYTEVPYGLYEKKFPLAESTSRIYGFFAYINDFPTKDFPILKIVLDMTGSMYSVPIELDPRLTLTDAVCAFLEDKGDTDAISNYFIKSAIAELIDPLLSMLLYICSDKPEIDNFREPGTAPSRVALKKVKNGFRFFVPSGPRIWIVGEKTGEAIRKYATSGEYGKSKRPHLRRAHWHGYWHGKRDRREFRLAWLSPIPVNADLEAEPEKTLSESRPDPIKTDNHLNP
jgi:hypothetical protein